MNWEVKPKVYVRLLPLLKPQFVPIHPEWHPPDVNYHGSVNVWICYACDTYIVESEPWTYFTCFNCEANYHRHCINLYTRKAIEDGLLKRWVCCHAFCLQTYVEQVPNLVAAIQRSEQYPVGPQLKRSKSVGQDLYGPVVITKPKLSAARSVCWAERSYEFENDKQVFIIAKESLSTKAKHMTAAMSPNRPTSENVLAYDGVEFWLPYKHKM